MVVILLGSVQILVFGNNFTFALVVAEGFFNNIVVADKTVETAGDIGSLLTATLTNPGLTTISNIGTAI